MEFVNFLKRTQFYVFFSKHPLIGMAIAFLLLWCIIYVLYMKGFRLSQIPLFGLIFSKENPPRNSGNKKSVVAEITIIAAAFTVVGALLLMVSFGDKEQSDSDICSSGHQWIDATCTTPKTCSICGVTSGSATGHKWTNATCTAPKTCRICGETSGSATGHKWTNATCTAPKTCSICGETSGSATGHKWTNATCTTPQTCSICGQTNGSATGHKWTNATYTSPKTCSVCGTTEGEKLSVEPIYINEMQYDMKYGKLWTRSSEEQEYFTHTPDHYPDCLEDLTTPGHSAGPVRDNQGNVYTYGLHLDGADSDRFYIIYKLDGMYSTFSGTCAFPGDLLSPRWSYQYEKYFEIYGDGKLLYASPKMNEDRDPDSFSLNVTGIMELKIVYPDNHGPNEVATLFDGMLS